MAYAKRYAGGFADNAGGATPIDSVFLNAVETALLELLSADGSVDGQVMQWIQASSKFGPALLLNKNVDPAAGIVKSKLDFTGGNGIVNADVAGAANISKSKLNLAASLTQAEMAAGNLVTTSLYSGGPPGSPTTGDIWIGTAVDTGNLATTTGIRWMFQYNGSSGSANKWEFIGGPPMQAVDLTARAVIASAPWADVTGSTISFTVARAGDYDATVMGDLHNTGASAAQTALGLSIGGADPVSGDSLDVYSGAIGPEIASSWTYFARAIAAAGVIKPRYQSQLTSTFLTHKVSYIPRRIS